MKKNIFYKINNIIRTYGLKGMILYIKKVLVFYWYLYVSKSLICTKIHNYKMFLDPKDPGISKTLFLHGNREQQLKYIMEKEINKGDTIIDLGANIGYYALLEWTLIGNTGKIYALEPSSRNYSLLNKNISLNSANDVIETFKLAGGDCVKTEKFYLSQYSNLNTFIKDLYHSGEKSKGINDNNYELVDIVDMSSFINDKNKINIIRMDIEGYEVEVLTGLKKAIEKGTFDGKIVFECHFPKYDDDKHSMREQLNMLFNNGYYPKIMTSNNEKYTHFQKKGYKPDIVIKTSIDTFQGVYYGVSKKDAIYFICDVGGVRDILLEKKL